MIKIYTVIAFVLLITTGVFAQSKTDSAKKDTIRQIQPVTVKAYLSELPVLNVPASINVINQQHLNLQPENSFVPVLNSQPGVRAEERSPGSYRLSIRGSLLRSPFGVRDVKIYFDDIPLTDAGGNTYLNAIDFNSIHNMEVLKGPDGSLFGANTGGVVLLSPVDHHADSSFLSAGLNGGSYGLIHENTALQQKSGNYQLNLNQAYESYDGYRQHSAMHRNYLQVVNSWTYNKNDQLRLLGFYSSLDYQTPGGLTLAQYQADPSSARPATKFTPGAIQQNSGIYQKVLFGGVVNEYHFDDHWRNVLSVFGTYVDFANPFITDYENRYESTYGFRTYFEYTGNNPVNYKWKTDFGVEWQQTNSDINNYGNVLGVRDTAQTLDKINTNQHFLFARYVADFSKRLHIEGALSINFYNYDFKNTYPNDEAAFTNRNFTPQLMPRIAAAYQLGSQLVWRASVSRGYSTPTTAEIRPTDHEINTGLQAQDGWNYETGMRFFNKDESLYLDASVFYYHINNAIVPRFHPDETEYYINAGGLNQPGLEIYFSDWLIKQRNTGFIRGLQFNQSVTFDHFTFSNDYHDVNGNYAGKQLTGTPDQMFVTSLQFKLPQNFYFYAEYNYTARIPLTDASTAYAPSYNLLQAKAGWEHFLGHKSLLRLYVGADNLLNEKYSLGDDFNAVGNRFYNAAALRNYYLGITLIY